MPKLIVTSDQESVLTTLETHLENAFSTGVETTTSTPVYDPMQLYSTPAVQAVKEQVKGPFESLAAAILVALNIPRALPVGLSTTVSLARLTPLGSEGSLTFVDGLLVSKVDPT